MLTYYFLQFLAWILALTALTFLILHCTSKKSWKYFKKFLFNKKTFAAFSVILLALGINFYATHPYPPYFAMPAWMVSHAPGGLPASIPILNIFKFLSDTERFAKIGDISADPTNVPKNNETRFSLTAQEVISEVAPGIYFNYWTYNGQVPGPMLKVRQGDNIVITLTNHKSSLHPHNIDLHSVTGPGGGAALTNVAPGETKSFKWKALNPGLYEYHCATANVSTHNAHGQYGLILVEPTEGLATVDREFYIMQGELYTAGGLGKKGLVNFAAQSLLDGIPSYITFNGRIESTPRLKANTGERIRIYVGNGGINLISSFHIIGEIFDTVYPEGAIGSAPLKNVQTTAVLPGGATIVEFALDVPGRYILVDHALARLNKGAWAVLEVNGPDRPDIFQKIN